MSRIVGTRPNGIPIHAYDLSQQTLAAYWMQTIGLLPSTDFSYGGRVQSTSVTARDTLHNPADCAAEGFCDSAGCTA